MKKYFFAALSIVGMIAIGAIASAQVSKVSADAEGIT